MIESFKERLNAPPSTYTPAVMSRRSRCSNSLVETSTTPPGSPPANLAAALQGKAAHAVPPTAPIQNGQSILDALANIARQNTTAPPTSSSVPAPAAPYTAPPPAAGPPQPVSSIIPPQSQVPPQTTYPPTSQPAVNLPPSLPFPMPQIPGMPGAAPNVPNTQFPGAPAAPGGGGALDPNTQQQILLIKALAESGVPFDKIPALIQSMTSGTGAGATPPQAPASAPPTSYPPGQPSWGGQGSKPDGGRDWYNDSVRSPGRYRDRSRSKSPDRGWGARGSPRSGRDRSDYGRNSPSSRGRDDDRRNGDYRTRSPPRRRGQSPPSGEKWTDYDPNLPSGTIKVLSRTLFVGGVT